MSIAPVPATNERPPVAVAVRQAIERQSTAFREVLPSIVDPDRFSRLVMNAIKASPGLVECFQTDQGQMTVLLAAMQAASIGLEPNTPTQHCWLLPRRNKGVMECQLSIGYRGYLKLARRSGNIKTVYAQEVRANDEFDWERGLEEDHLHFKPAAGTRGDLTHAYAVARYKTGGYSFVVLSEYDVHRRRAMSDSWKGNGRDYSPWTKWPEEMWRKTAIRALVPYLDLDVDVANGLATDERRLDFDDESGFINVDAGDEPAGELEAGRVTAAEIIAQEPAAVPATTARKATAAKATPSPAKDLDPERPFE